jgi:predicted GNAT superfamily acetyltransferase
MAPYVRRRTLVSPAILAVRPPRSLIADSAASTAESVPGVVVRLLASLDDYRACVALQREIWGDEFEGAVPAALMQVATYVGGLAVGAFAPDGDLVGVVFGLTGVQEGRVVHWSHVLGVRASMRNAGVGRMLKGFQRAELARRGVGEMYWTFDPLIARNAHLNLNVLGARVVRYVSDMYGDTGSPLHHGLATDRLVVACDTAPPPRRRPAASERSASRVAILTAEPHAGDELLTTGSDRPATVAIEIPTDFPPLLARSPSAAARWHAATREHFLWALRNAYVVTGLRRDAVTSRSFYMLDAGARTS